MKLSNLFLITLSLIIFIGAVWLKRNKQELFIKEPEEFSFIVVGHIYPQYDALKSVIKQAEEEGAVFIILTGDLINGESKSIEERWQGFEEIKASTKIPFYIAPGNHDVGDKGKRKIFEEKFGPTYRSFIFENSKFILLNSCDATKDFKEDIDQEQLDFLKIEYQDSWEFEHIFLFIHHPLWLKDFSLTNGRYPENSWDREVLPLIKEKTKYVFAGDSFTFFYTKREGVYYLVNGFGQERRQEVPYFLHVKVKGKEVTVEVRTALPEAKHKIYFFEDKESR